MFLNDELNILKEAVVEAGQAVLSIAREEFKITFKMGTEPVTTANIIANSILKDRLLGRFPQCGWLSEKTRNDPSRQKKKRAWIVNPIDGTKEFMCGIPEYSVSVALVEEGLPVLSAVYNPAEDLLFTAVKGQGAMLNGNPIRADHRMQQLPVVLASRSEISRGEFKQYESYAVIKPVGSIAYKLALVAAGRADAILSLGHKNEWDIAAGVLLVEEAGGKVTDSEGEPMFFNRGQTLVNGIIASTKEVYLYLTDLIESNEYIERKIAQC